MMYLVVLFFGCLIGTGIGLLWNKDELKREIELRKEWEKTAKELTERVAGKVVWLKT